MADQLAHIFVLAGLSFLTNEVVGQSIVHIWIYILAYIVVSSPVSVLIGFSIPKIIPGQRVKSISNVSKYIGVLERILILTFIFVNQFEAIGFLIAAKSIFRFNEAKEGQKQKAEYFLFGTLLSFTVAVLVGISVTLLLKN
ncbi:hypothetical protein MNBD_BACTEROID01-669 [hydrothermal vent metagenome]|uniref:Uncharacterized protein n=1 Tax=hydrothermal vent metagenome TaxID=652676 RepID=A0A3B0T9N6_9ZZZZ